MQFPPLAVSVSPSPSVMLALVHPHVVLFRQFGTRLCLKVGKVGEPPPFGLVSFGLHLKTQPNMSFFCTKRTPPQDPTHHSATFGSDP